MTETSINVIPAKAGIHGDGGTDGCGSRLVAEWTPAFAGVTANKVCG